MRCNAAGNEDTIDEEGPLQTVKPGGCDYTTYTVSKANCPLFTLNALWQFLAKFFWFFGIVFVVLGFFIGLFGKKLFSVVLFVIGMLITTLFILFLFYWTFLKTNTEDWVGWVVLISALIAGIGGGYLLYKCQKCGAAAIGAWGGFIFGMLLNTAFLVFAESEWLFWVTCLSCAGAGFVLGFCCLDTVVISATSLGGSYMFIRGFSFYIGGYPNEFVLARALKTGSMTGIEPWFYLYLGLMIIGTIVNMWV